MRAVGRAGFDWLMGPAVVARVAEPGPVYPVAALR